MNETLRSTVETVRERVEPTDAEREQLEKTAAHVIERTKEAVAELPVEADVLRVGSTGRETWLRGDRDIDVFVRFPTTLDRESLREYGLAVGHRVLPDGRLEYAEHPYVTGEVSGYSIDLVPCFGVESAADIRSAVDRTPFHAEYISDRLARELATDVRVLKRFCETIGIYGSDLRTRGFSGYLSELLVLEYGGFIEVVEAAAEWRPPVILDPENHAAAEFDDPLVVIDPTDPQRNVAAVVTTENVARFQHHARLLIADPSTERFEVPAPATIDANALTSHLDARSTTVIAVRFPVPEMVEDQLYPQLRRSRDGIVDALGERGFLVLRADLFAREDAVIFLELAISEQPAITRHPGPPVHVRNHAEAFLARWDGVATYGPFIQGDRYVVEREREFTTATAFLRSDAILEARLGAEIEEFIAHERDVLVGDQILDLLPTFAEELAAFYDPKP